MMFKQYRTYVYTLSFLFVCWSMTQGCVNKNKQDILGSCDTSDTKFSTVVKPIIDMHCNSASGCHGSISQGAILLEGYQNVKDNYANILVRVKSGDMPKNNPKLDNCTIFKIESWINKGAINN